MDSDTNDRPLEKFLGFRVSMDEYEAVTLAAQAKELSVTEYIRQRMNMSGVIEQADRIRELARTG